MREAADWASKHANDVKTIAAERRRCFCASTPKKIRQSWRVMPTRTQPPTCDPIPRDVDALLVQVEAELARLAADARHRVASLALRRAAGPNFPLAHLPTTWGNELISAAQAASPGNNGYTDADLANAKTLLGAPEGGRSHSGDHDRDARFRTTPTCRRWRRPTNTSVRMNMSHLGDPELASST